jgi:hypothetical protein
VCLLGSEDDSGDWMIFQLEALIFDMAAAASVSLVVLFAGESVLRMEMFFVFMTLLINAIHYSSFPRREI